MQRYNVDSVALELNNLEAVLAERITNYLETNDLVNAARGLIAVNKEIFKIEEDARRLRLTGQLDVNVYTALAHGYRKIADRIVNVAHHHNYAREISALHKALRFTNDAPSLSDYLREGDE